ncbi:antibiotic biosynthesis monooxygenase [Pseudomonadales bacterium]|nr:antibiotic biosynthesis monooxygenase [Pseudomonadales bacterium]
MAEKVVLSGFITVPAGEVERVLELLPEHITLTLAEPGCLIFEVRQRADTPTIFDTKNFKMPRHLLGTKPGLRQVLGVQ